MMSLGNAATAAAMGALGNFVSPGAPFFAAAVLCVPAFVALWLIDGGDIDYARARGAARAGGSPSPRAGANSPGITGC